MIDTSLWSRVRDDRLPFAVILGCNEIASAVAVHLHRTGHAVALSHDPLRPVIRRGMAFHDALFGDCAVIEEVTAIGIDHGLDIVAEMTGAGRVVATRLSLTDLLAIGGIDTLIDARMHKQAAKPDLRHLAATVVGLGPGFHVGGNCDVAIETRPARNGTILDRGSTDEADGVPARLGGAGRERFVYARDGGHWCTAAEIGQPVRKGAVLGHLEGDAVLAPMDGSLRGIARDGTTMPPGVKVLEVDPRGDAARWTGIDDRGRRIAQAALTAISLRSADLGLVETLSGGVAHDLLGVVDK